MKRRNTAPRRAKAAAALALAAAALLSVTASGCGSGGTSPLIGGPQPIGSAAGARKTGRAVFRVKWPEITRLIPEASQSIVIVLKKGDAEVGRATLDRPASEAVFGDLEPGDDYMATAEAFPNPGGTGVAQARKSTAVAFTVADGQDVDIRLTLDSTIETVEVTPTFNYAFGEGRVKRITAVAKDAEGNIVITSQNKVTFTLASSQPGLATVTPDGNTPEPDADLAIVGSVNSPQTVTVTATDTESGKSGQQVINVVPVGLEETAPWAKFHGNAHNSGRITFGSPTTGDGAVFFGTGSSIVFSSPAVGPDGTVYVGSYDTNFYAINPDGSEKWRVATGGVIESSPAIGRNGLVYVGSTDGNLYGVRAATGEVQFTFTTDGEVFGPPAIGPTGIVYFGSTGAGRTLYAIDGNSGEELWRFEGAGGGIQTAPALLVQGDTVTVYFGSLDGRVYALNGRTGEQVYAPYATGDAIFSSAPAISDDGTSIYIGSLDGKLHGLRWDLTPKWAEPFDANAPIYSTPAIGADGTVYFGSFDNFTGLNDSNVFAVNGATGELRPGWPFAVDDGITSSPAIGADGTIYIGSYDDNVYAINPNGTLKWSYLVGGGGGGVFDIDSSPGFGPDGAIYIGGFDGNVYRIR
jgi:FOG: WD40-like repeat